MMQNTPFEGIVLVNKSIGSTSFHIVSQLRRITGVEKIGHAGTLDPFARGVMVMLVGKKFTTRSTEFLQSDKEYIATVKFGQTTDTYDLDGQVTSENTQVPTSEQVEQALLSFQGKIEQVPPMFSAKKMGGKKLYELARKGIEIERPAVQVELSVQMIDYTYPELHLSISCSKGTYIRSIAHDLGQKLGCGAHLIQLTRTRSGKFRLDQCIDQELLKNKTLDLKPYLLESL